MPSDAKKARDAAKKAALKAKANGKVVSKTENGTSKEAPTANGNGVATNGKSKIEEEIDEASNVLRQIEIDNAKARSVAGALTSNPKGLDHKVEGLTVTFHGREIVVDTKLELNRGRRYGFLGLNGSGKSTLIHAIYNHELPIPENVDMYLVSREMSASDISALDAVMDVDSERKDLEAKAEELAACPDDESQDKLMDIYERLDEMDADMAEKKAAELLHGLGFTKTMQQKKCRDFSGGWRMRIALARALFLKPSILLLDEPTNHLDLEACVWLEEELKQYKRTLLVVSHSQDFLNGVCTNIIHLFQKQLVYYTGNYDQFVKTRDELLENQAKRYNWEQSQLQNMKDYIARFGHGSAKLARQAQSKEKTMAKMVAGGLTERAQTETVKQFYFFDAGEIPPPVIMVQHVSFRYNETTPWIYKDIDFGIDLDTRIALVGPNGAGKSTLLKLLCADVMPSDGLIRRHSHVKIGRYHQMSEEGGAGAVGPTQIDNKPKDDKIEKPQAVMEKESSAENSAPTQKTAVPAAAPEEVSTARSELSLRSPTLSTIVAGSPGDAASPALNTAIASTPNPPSMRRSIRRSVRRSTSSKSRRQRATLLTFHEIVGKETLARVQLVLCNISDRTLRFKLKSNPESKLTVRVVLSWSRENEEISWREAAQPKILLVTKFLDDNEITGLQEQATSTRLVHLHEELPLDKSALEFMMSAFPDVKEKEEMRKVVGRYGITGREQVCPMKQLSDGQRCRVSFAWLAWQQPHLLLLDEPTNHLDMESIDALAEAINCFPGGMILVSHDFRLVSQVAQEVWVCDNHKITKWDGDIFSFKEHLRNEMDKATRARQRQVIKER